MQYAQMEKLILSYSFHTPPFQTLLPQSLSYRMFLIKLEYKIKCLSLPR